MSILSVFETLLGVFMTSSFVGVLTRRYSIQMNYLPYYRHV
ncbi:hypothetical protein [Clostridium butyricum]|nr:MAG TPA: hypothetical protein [Caudoviricetes sp.]